MRADITQQNLYLILAGKAAAVAAIQALFGCGRRPHQTDERREQRPQDQ